MTGLYIFGGLFLAGIIVITFFVLKSRRDESRKYVGRE
jgi:hypothetical protein